MFDLNCSSVRIINHTFLDFHIAIIKNHKNEELCFVQRGSAPKDKNKITSSSVFDFDFSEAYKSPFITNGESQVSLSQVNDFRAANAHYFQISHFLDYLKS